MGYLSGLWDAIRNVFSGGASGTTSDLSGPIHRLYVGNLSYKVKEEELRALFAKYGRVKTLHLIRDRVTRRLKGYAFLEMGPEDARKALALNGADFLGRKLIVSAAKSKQQQQQRAQRRRSSPMRWRKRRSGPRAYGAQKDDTTPIERLE
jgi:RNA recognition motif-containing protein